MSKPRELCLTIPCSQAEKSKGVEPLHVHVGDDSTGAAMTRWVCTYCGAEHHRRKPCLQHMGMIPNIKACCPVLQAEDERRRATLRDFLGGS